MLHHTLVRGPMNNQPNCRLLFQVLEMFYKGRNFSFVVILPRNKGDLLTTLETVSDPSEWNKILESLKPERVDVNLPKMIIKTNINLQPLLTKVGKHEYD